MQLHRATDDKVLKGAPTIAWGLPRSASEQEWNRHVRRLSRGGILLVSKHVSLWVICSVMEG